MPSEAGSRRRCKGEPAHKMYPRTDPVVGVTLDCDCKRCVTCKRTVCAALCGLQGLPSMSNQNGCIISCCRMLTCMPLFATTSSLLFCEAAACFRTGCCVRNIYGMKFSSSVISFISVRAHLLLLLLHTSSIPAIMPSGAIQFCKLNVTWLTLYVALLLCR